MSEPAFWPDGVGALCSGWIRLVTKRDDGRRFRYIAIRSPYARAMAQASGIDPGEPIRTSPC